MNLRISRLAMLALVLATMVAMIAPAGGALAQSPEPLRDTIKVVGVGTAFTNPDIAYISLGVDTANPNISEAVNSNNSTVEAVQAALVGAGIADGDIRTEGLYIYREQIYDNGMPTDNALFRISNAMRVTVRNIESIPSVLQAALDAGVTNVNNVQYDVADKSAIQSEARAAAIEDAKAKAAELAELMGVQVGDVVAISEYSYSATPYYSNGGFGGGGGGAGGVTPPPVQGGALAVDLSVEVTFAIVR
jgi:hypothetical protein